MLFHWVVGMVIIAGISAILGMIVGGFPHKHPKGFFRYFISDRFGLTCAITFLILLGMASLGLGIGRVYIVTNLPDSTLYWSIGKPAYTFSDGHDTTLNPHCVVNDTDQALVLESIAYGDREFNEDIFIEPGTAATFDTPGVIHYLFENAPPPEIETKTGGASQWWLRHAE